MTQERDGQQYEVPLAPPVMPEGKPYLNEKDSLWAIALTFAMSAFTLAIIAVGMYGIGVEQAVPAMIFVITVSVVFTALAGHYAVLARKK